jgi:hypothetical protein
MKAKDRANNDASVTTCTIMNANQDLLEQDGLREVQAMLSRFFSLIK